MKKFTSILLISFLCLLSVGCNKDNDESSSASSIKIYGTVTALGEPVPDCTIEVSPNGFGVYSSAITGNDGTYEVTFVPTDAIDNEASVYLKLSLYGEQLISRFIPGIALGSSLHYDFDITNYLY